MNKLDSLILYADTLGQPVSSPVLRVGTGAPHVVMVALQHGWEIIGLDTALQVMNKIKQPIGTITLISVASPMAYQDGSRLSGSTMGPSSKQQSNMNRVHPGQADGNAVERSAKAIDSYIQGLKPDYVIDLHSYASQSIPHCIVDPCTPKVYKTVEDWVIRSQNIWYKEYTVNELTNQNLDKALSAIWVQRGIPAVTIELGPIQLFSPEQSQLAQRALSNLLSACGAIHAPIVSQQQGALSSSKRWRRAELIYTGDRGGYLRPLVSIGTAIKQGSILAEIVTPDGTIVDSVGSPNDGVHFVWHNEFRVLAGSLIGVILIEN